jgi:transposase
MRHRSWQSSSRGRQGPVSGIILARERALGKRADDVAGMRDQWIRRRTQLTNAIRGYAAEFGVIAAKGVNKIEALLTRIAEDETLPKLAKELFAQYRQDYARLQVAIEKIEAKLMA